MPGYYIHLASANDKALKNKDVIFVNLSVEKAPKISEYQSLGKIGTSPFTLYSRRTYDFFRKIINLFRI